jgi:penicillin amidase
MVIPQGESGEPGSPHYRDGAPVWLRGALVPLRFEDAAVARDRTSTLELTP